jgi:hypothetical protein
MTALALLLRCFLSAQHLGWRETPLEHSAWNFTYKSARFNFFWSGIRSWMCIDTLLGIDNQPYFYLYCEALLLMTDGETLMSVAIWTHSDGWPDQMLCLWVISSPQRLIWFPTEEYHRTVAIVVNLGKTLSMGEAELSYFYVQQKWVKPLRCVEVVSGCLPVEFGTKKTVRLGRFCHRILKKGTPFFLFNGKIFKYRAIFFLGCLGGGRGNPPSLPSLLNGFWSR